jgi:processive rubber oxygenase RoxA-like protein
MKSNFKRKIFRRLFVLLLLVIVVAWFGWYKLLRAEPEQKWADESERFKYGSIGAEFSRGMPYWIWVVLPRVFPDLMPGPGGYKAFGLVWEEGHEMPVGFTKQVIGFPRVANNCAVCHVGTWRSQDDEVPHVVVASPANTVNIQAMLRFLTKAAQDSRFNSSVLLTEIERETKLSFTDKMLYRFVLIPMTRSALQQQEARFAWMNRPNWPDWGQGRDDPMNLTKYFMTSQPVDDTVGQADFPSNWNLQARKGTNDLLNWCGESPAVRSVLIDSALGLGAAPDKTSKLTYPVDWLDWELERRAWFLKRMDALDDFLSAVQPPKYPFAVDTNLAAQGKPIYARLCADCHDVGAPRTSKVIPIAEIGTDTNRIATWNQAAADQANTAVKNLGITRPDLIQNNGYCSVPLDGLWMRAPYLHNGSVPTLRDLLEPVEKRPQVFYRGYDVYDPVNVGFVSSGPKAESNGWKVDVTVRGNGNQGHNYGTDLTDADKQALLEYLKTF